MKVSIRLLNETSYMKPLSFIFLIFECLNVYEVWYLNIARNLVFGAFKIRILNIFIQDGFYIY